MYRNYNQGNSIKAVCYKNMLITMSKSIRVFPTMFKDSFCCGAALSLNCPAFTYSLLPLLLVAETFTDIEPERKIKVERFAFGYDSGL